MKLIKWKPGIVIKTPGVYVDVPIDVYHGQEICDGPSVSSSTLRDINPDLGSPAHCFDKWSGNPAREDDDDKNHFKLGRALHHLMLGEKHFASLFVKQPDQYVVDATDNNGKPKKDAGTAKPWNNNAGECRRWQAEQRDLGRAVLTADMLESLKQMAIKVGNHAFYKSGALTDGVVECSMFWKDKETGLWVKWRPDSFPWDSADFADLKTTTSVLYVDLKRTIRDLGYYQQAALGLEDGCTQVMGMKMDSFSYLFVEKTRPFSVRDLRLEDETMLRGRRMNRACLRRFADCLEKGHWPDPGYGNEGNERIGLSGQAMENIDTILKYEGLADGHD